ncbi:membrane protein insertion efficiency factor YidD [Thiosocius teredinicola]|uniref:membrane protein insertion efficiency factor YidD n=1 Tax=Thiosocius teredinicola TaxID=1973002 RepID=UPI000990CD24
MEKIAKRIEAGGNTYDCQVEPHQLPTIERLLRGKTDGDEKIAALPVPSRPFWLRLTVISLRWYGRRISPKLGSRCVFEPSCSHYSELAFRKRGFFKGVWLTAKRLRRCRPGSGGIDLP